jgi:hypothetical protein
MATEMPKTVPPVLGKMPLHDVCLDTLGSTIALIGSSVIYFQASANHTTNIQHTSNTHPTIQQ